MRIVSADALQRMTTAIFERCGASPDTAACVASHLVEANLAGHDSHGVLRIMQYVEVIDAGDLRPAGRCRSYARRRSTPW